MAKTEEDWFLRGGERPDTAEGNTDSNDASGAHGDGDGLKDYIVTMSRRRTVVQNAKVRVKAYSECDAMDRADEMASDKGDEWDWKDVDWDSEEFEDVEADDAEEADT